MTVVSTLLFCRFQVSFVLAFAHRCGVHRRFAVEERVAEIGGH
jgi:hypothetical protein